MDDVLYLKFRQHRDLRTLLLNTFPADLVYVESGDPFWGDGAGAGMNELGKSLMRVREWLRNPCGLPLLSGIPVHHPHTNLQLIIRIRVCQKRSGMETNLASPSLAIPSTQRTRHQFRQPILRPRKLSNYLLHP
jgi:hypothetical protein